MAYTFTQGNNNSWGNFASAPANTQTQTINAVNSASSSGGGMGIWGIVSSLLGSLGGSNSQQSGGQQQSQQGGMWSSYMPQQTGGYRSAGGISGMLDVSGRAQAAKSGALNKGSVIGDTFLGGGLGLFTKAGKKKEYEFDPYSVYSEPQLASVRGLESLASTGSGAGINLGKAYEGDLGYYTQNEGELGALSGLQSLVSGQDITGARDVYSRMANNRFAPDDPTTGYAAYGRQLDRAQKEASGLLEREAAITGNRYGSQMAKSKADLAEVYADQKATKLSDLYNLSENRALQGASGLQSLIGTQQNLFNQIASQAAIERQLKNQAAEDKYAEFARQQSEQYMRLGLMENQRTTPMGKIKYTM